MNLRSLLGLAVSAVFLYIFFRSVDLDTIVRSVGDAQLLWLVPATGVYFSGLWLRAARWKRLMAPFAAVSTARLFRVITIGFAVNNVLPFRLGELVRTVLLRHSHGVPIAATLASILLERVLDVAALCSFLVVVSLFVPLEGWLAGLAGLSWIVVGGGVAGFILLLIAPRAVLRRELERVTAAAGRLSARLAQIVDSFLNGMRALETPAGMLAIGFLSVASWAAELGLYFFVMLAFGFDSGLLGLVVGMVAANLATVVPSSPGYVGTFDVPLQLVLGEFGVPMATASSYTLVTHAVLLVPVVAVGLVLLGRENLSLGALRRGRIQARSRPQAPIVAPASSLPDPDRRWV